MTLHLNAQAVRGYKRVLRCMRVELIPETCSSICTASAALRQQLAPAVPSSSLRAPALAMRRVAPTRGLQRAKDYSDDDDDDDVRKHPAFCQIPASPGQPRRFVPPPLSTQSHRRSVRLAEQDDDEEDEEDESDEDDEDEETDDDDDDDDDDEPDAVTGNLHAHPFSPDPCLATSPLITACFMRSLHPRGSSLSLTQQLDALDLGEEVSDDFGKMVYRMMVVAYFVLLPSYFWCASRCLTTAAVTKPRAPRYDHPHVSTIFLFPLRLWCDLLLPGAGTGGCTRSNGTCPTGCTTRPRFASPRCLAPSA